MRLPFLYWRFFVVTIDQFYRVYADRSSFWKEYAQKRFGGRAAEGLIKRGYRVEDIRALLADDVPSLAKEAKAQIDEIRERAVRQLTNLCVRSIQEGADEQEAVSVLTNAVTEISEVGDGLNHS